MASLSVPARLLPLLEAIRLAPSAHNTQPWRLQLRAADSIEIAWDPTRWLEVADPGREHLLYSVGCAIEAACSVAAVECECALPTAGERRVAKLRLEKGAGAGADEALALLRARRTNRAAFHPGALDTALLRELEKLAAELGVEASLRTDRADIEAVAELTARGAESCVLDPAYLAELLAWVRLSEREPDFDRDGFSPEALGIDPLSARMLGPLKRSARLRALLPRLGMARFMGLQAARALRRSAALLLLATRSADMAARLAGGRALLRVWLAATRSGVALQPVHFPLSRGDLRAAMLARFGLPPEAQPVTLVRLGLPTRAAPISARLPLDRILSLGSGA
jgi:nitroreductase